MNNPSKERAALINNSKSGRSAYGGPKIKKTKSTVPSKEKQKPGKTLDLSLKTTKEPLNSLPSSFKDSAAEDELRKLDLTGQYDLFKNAGLGPLRFAGGTLTWLNLSGVDCSSGNPASSSSSNGTSMEWLFLKMMQALIVLNLSECNLSDLPQELSSVTTLKALVASHNTLTSPSLVHLASLKDLNSLILSDNQLTSFPTSVLAGLTSLKKLSLANNNLKNDGLPDFSVNRETLEEVRLNGNEGITSIPSFAPSTSTSQKKETPSSPGTSSISLLELSHTGISDLKELKRLTHLPKLINLGLRDTKISENPDYRAQVTEVLPNLRILDNVRFDPLYLARKERNKEDEAGNNAGDRRSKSSSKHQNGRGSREQDSGWQRKSQQSETSGFDKGKKREREQMSNTQMATTDTSRSAHSRRNDSTRSKGKNIGKSEMGSRSDMKGTAESTEEHEPKRKRMKKAKKVETAPPQPSKPPKSIGGSLSAPETSSSAGPTLDGKTAASASTGNANAEVPSGELDLNRLAKEKSSVVGVVEVKASTKKAKERPKKGGRGHSDTKGQSASEGLPEANVKPDVLALLEQEKAKTAFVGGWD